MNIETLIYAYLAVCTSMIIFNCVSIFVFRQQDTSLKKHSSSLETEVLKQIQLIEAGETLEQRHEELLQKKLGSTNNLLAFDETLEKLQEQMPDSIRLYLRGIRPVFTFLAADNKYSNTIKLTYFAYFIRKYRIIEGESSSAIVDMMMKLLQEDSLYCRESALHAIYSTGDCKCVLQALRTVDESNRFHHAKLLTDGLFTFTGDKQQLALELWDSFDSFSVSMQVVILDYIRFSGGDLKEEFLQVLADNTKDDELRFSCIRYFGKYPYESAFPLLLEFVQRPQKQRWEYAAIAVTALASYPGERTVEVMKKALTSSNWYIRFNAAKSLESFQLTYLELSDVIESNDRYAREIMQYQVDLNNVRKEKEGTPV